MVSHAAYTDHRECAQCVMDTTDPGIVFDGEGVCNHCKGYFARRDEQVASGEEGQRRLSQIVEDVKRRGRGREYDCVVGVSGGVDSSFVACLAKKLGLRPLAVHMDNGWDSETAVNNIHNLCTRLGLDLDTHVIDWEEFRDIQLAFFRAHVVDIEMVTDHAITAVVYRTAAERGIKYILNGGNMATEAILPVSWRHTKSDLRNLKAIHKRYGTKKLRSYPTAGIFKIQYYKYINGIKSIQILDSFPYDKEEAVATLQEKVGWKDYGKKHHESVFTRFYQAHILPRKFNIDKRRAHLSNLICAGEITRQQSVEELKRGLYDPHLLRQDLAFVRKKLGFSVEQFEEYLKAPSRSHFDYPTDQRVVALLLRLKKILTGDF